LKYENQGRKLQVLSQVCKYSMEGKSTDGLNRQQSLLFSD
jgi:hypothetical protein